MKKPRISIIGLGRVGTAFLHVLSDHGYEITSVHNRSEVANELLSKYSNIHFSTSLPDQLQELGELTFITAADDAIISISENLAANFDSLSGRSFVHCSGTLSSSALKPLKTKGAAVASFHPMKSITPKTTGFADVWFDVEGDDGVLSMLETLASELRAHSFRVEPEAKPLLHASAVVASNYLVVLADLAASISKLGNIPEEISLKALKPLMENTLQNISELGVEGALTGPIIRRDVETVRDHLKRLEGHPEILSLYKKLGARALSISERAEGDSEEYQKIRELLS